MIDLTFTRRRALGIAAAILASLRARASRGEGRGLPQAPPVAPPADELDNAFEFEDQAKLVLPADVFATISGTNRDPFDRMTFRPRLCIPTTDMDLTTPMFGSSLYTPILVGPIADQRRFHPEGELEMVRGAGASYTTVIVSSRSSIPFPQLMGVATTPLWFNVFVEPEARRQAETAIGAGAGALFITVGVQTRPGAVDAPTRASIDWGGVETLRRGLNVPIVIKGITTPEEANAAVRQGADGIVVSNYGDINGPGAVETLAAIADAVNGRTQILVDGSFRRGTDVLKALILGADGVMLARPAAWGLAAYGASGVQHALRLIQNELARSMGMLGAPTPAHLTRNHVRQHKRVTV
jgi:4-hydroxymandelate oxidase